MAAYIPPGQQPPPPAPTQHNSYIPPPPRGTMSKAELTQAAQRVSHLNNRDAWRAIGKALGNAGIPLGYASATAARAVWAERKAQRRAARAAGLPWRPSGKAQIRARRRLSVSAPALAPPL